MTDGSSTTATSPAADHPAPARHRVPATALWFGLLGAPAAWSVQTLVDLPLASHGCFPFLSPVPVSVIGSLRGIVFVVSIFAILVCIAALTVALKAWRRTSAEHQGASGKASDHAQSSSALETGEGRTRFMALAGVLTSFMFLLGSVAHVVTIFMVSPCFR